MDMHTITHFLGRARALRPSMALQRRLLVAAWLLCWPLAIAAQTQEAQALIDSVYALNNAFQYVASQQRIHRFIDQPGQTAANKYYAYLALSFTYKRQFDYTSTLACLEKALAQGLKTEHPQYFEANIHCQRALAYFDIHEYQLADSLMRLLAASDYEYLDGEHLSKIMMQEAFLLYRAGRLSAAEKRYNEAIALMEKSSPCDLPMIYGKKILLYGQRGDTTKLRRAYQACLAKADSCGIWKYRIYAMEMLADGLAASGHYRQAFEAQSGFMDENTLYVEKEQLKRMHDLERQYETAQIKQEVLLKEQEINTKNAYMLLAFAMVVVTTLLAITLILKLRERHEKEAKENSELFTKQLLLAVEEERQRLASELHDHIGHELLQLRAETPLDLQAKIDHAISELRGISRNLSPVMFETVGLVQSIEQLALRVQQSHNFVVSVAHSGEIAPAPAAALQVYRIIQEALNNTAKHAQATATNIVLAAHDWGIEVTIQDNGTGFDVEKAMGGAQAFGLFSIMARAKAIGGEATIKSSSQGTTISLRINYP